MEIRHLIDAPAARPTLVRWFEAEWAPHYGPDGPGDAAADLAACADRDTLPIGLVGLDDGDRPIGTAALRTDSVGSDIAPGPWLAGLLVTAEHRNRGVGTALVAAIETEAWRLGHGSVYCSTDRANSMLARRDWVEIGTSMSLRGRIVVFRKDTAPQVGP